MKYYLFIYILTIFTVNSYSQESINQLDSAGKRHGVWKKYFDKTKQLRYQGQFDHGKEIDTFKFYRLNFRTDEWDYLLRYHYARWECKKIQLLVYGKKIVSKYPLGNLLCYQSNKIGTLSHEIDVFCVSDRVPIINIRAKSSRRSGL